ncbi:MAG: hypothetical protein CMH46_14790 [Muricauda sp.]|nr:hypothetical protein [Allomuricauda sp.]
MALLSGVILISCFVEDGMDGAPGPQGEPGNANVMVSPWIPEEFSDDSANYTSFTVTDETFTSEILNSSTVMVYSRAGVTVVPIPVVFSNKPFMWYFPKLWEKLPLLPELLMEHRHSLVFSLISDISSSPLAIPLQKMDKNQTLTK